jgi:transposase-like protein
MAKTPSPSSSFNASSLSSGPPAEQPAAQTALAAPAPDAKAGRDTQGHYTREFRLAAVRYAAACGKTQRAAAADMGVSDKTLSGWLGDARPDAAGVVDVARFDELAQLRAQNRELVALTARLTAERDFLKKCASYFATPPRGGSK